MMTRLKNLTPSNACFWLLVVAIVVLVGYAATTGWHYYFRVRPASLAEAQLRRVGSALKAYAANTPGEFLPPVSFDPLPFMFDISLLDPDLVEADDLESPGSHAADGPLGRRTYYYLGYAVLNGEDGLALLDAIRDAGPDSLVPTRSLKTDSHEFYALSENVDSKIDLDRQRREKEEAIRKRRERATQVDDLFGAASDGNKPTSRILNWIFPKVYATSTMKGPSEIPVLIEHPSLYGDGGHVLYTDGHIEFFEYSGIFPMTIRFIKALESFEVDAN